MRQPGYVRQVRAQLVAVVYSWLYHALLFELLLIDVHRNSTRTGLGLKYMPVYRHRKKENSFNKLICVIRIFMLKIFVVQCHPRNILVSNYFRITVYRTSKVVTHIVQKAI